VILLFVNLHRGPGPGNCLWFSIILILGTRLQIYFFRFLDHHWSFSEVESTHITFCVNVAVFKVGVLVWVLLGVFDFKLSKFVSEFGTTFLLRFYIIWLCSLLSCIYKAPFSFPKRWLCVFMIILKQYRACVFARLLITTLAHSIVFIELLWYLREQISGHLWHFTLCSSLLTSHLNLNFFVHFHRKFEWSPLV
jgi:hypothetical protein